MNNQTTSSRDMRIDIMRCIGVLFVILAHVNGPNTIETIRSFDVPLLIFVSGYCCSIKESESYGQYILKRVKRLAIPSWITMLIIFILGAILCVAARREYVFTVRQMVETCLFIGGKSGGIGLFWIVRIYLLMAMAAPVLLRLSKAVKNKYAFDGIVLACCLTGESLYRFFWNKNAVLNFVLEEYFISLVSYAAVFLLGVRAKTGQRMFSSLSLFTALTVMTQLLIRSTDGEYIVSDYKYPPQLAYIAWGITATLILWETLSKVRPQQKENALYSVILWMSKNSFDIYLAHAIVLRLISWGDRIVRHYFILNNWACQYLIIVLTSCILILIRNYCVQRIGRWNK